MAKAVAKKLEGRLVLHGWVTEMLGYKDTDDLLKSMRDCDEDMVGNQTRFHERLLTRNSKLKLKPDDLEDYDDNIRAHVDSVNRATTAVPITLRYFQYLALLYTEIVLDWWANRPAELVSRLNEYAEGLESEPIRFTEADLTKLAFWMATGSGKTLIMNINVRQFLHYDQGNLDNIILVTPNEGLSDQHIREMQRFGTPCERFSPDSGGAMLGNAGRRHTVKVTEITKLTENKKGSGVSVDVEEFEGRNLVLVDEGHKGSAAGLDASKEKAWRKRRNLLSRGGFTFEYSATFGQALSASKNDDLTEEYGKAILFDYSYRYFYEDEYGKDFNILNLKNGQDSREKTDLLLLGNLLSFYEQRRYYARHEKELADYMVEPPLWVFVGSSVNAVYTQNKQKHSDVLTVVSFLHRFLREREWAQKAIEKVFKGDTGLVDSDDLDVFAGRFGYLRSEADSPSTVPVLAEVYDSVLEEVFHARAGGGLHVATIRGSAGELGLKVAGANDYFGLVYIGDTTAFKNLLMAGAPEVVVEEDAFSASLFEGVNDRDSKINILIGARKFIEGWSSWRVSTMGLLNIGKTEGSQIIQLFGRGVRLKGKNFSMKRSSAEVAPGVANGHPSRLDLLETLGIFAVEANYMAQFREYLWREDIDPGGYVEMPLPIRREDEFLKKGLLVPQVPEGEKFADNCPLLLEIEDKITVKLDLSSKAQTTTMASEGLVQQQAKAGETRSISRKYLAMMDWPSIHLDLVEYKNTKGYKNLLIPKDAPSLVMHSERPVYELTSELSLVDPTDFAGLGRLRETVVSLLRKYVDRFYAVREQRWDSERLVLEELNGDHPNFADYVVRIGKSDAERIREVKDLIAEATKIYNEEVDALPNIHFDRHLFQPLLLDKEKVESSPKGLNDSEIAFVEELRAYCSRGGAGNGDASEATEIFLLRNESKKGVGFYYTAGFYPDFILWVKNGDSQRIVFIEPHGMGREDAPDTNEKIRLYRRLQELSAKLGKDSQWKNISLDSYIVSPTSYNEMADKWSGNWKPEDFFEEHIVFEERLGERMPEILGGSE